MVTADAVIESSIKPLVEWAQHHQGLLYVLVALAVGFVIGRYRAYRAAGFQNVGEELVSRRIQSNFGAPDYHLMNHVTLRLKDGTTQIDHVLVSRFGVFVIETKHYKGWIFANPKQARWTQVLFTHRFTFQNPLFQNDRHVRAIQRLLEFLPPEAIKSVVVFTGEAQFKTEVPREVLYIDDLVDHLREHTAEVMSPNRMQLCVGRLETERLAITGDTDVEHVLNIERRHGSST